MVNLRPDARVESQQACRGRPLLLQLRSKDQLTVANSPVGGAGAEPLTEPFD